MTVALPLSHYSNADRIEIRSVQQDNRRFDKPRGFWVSVDGDDDWPSWCAVEDYDIGANRFTVTLAPSANMLTLTTADEVIDFAHIYKSREFTDSLREFAAVDWVRVAQDYQGLIIAPYQWSLRLSGVGWYYTWDCASGCIWDAEAIGSVGAVQS